MTENLPPPTTEPLAGPTAETAVEPATEAQAAVAQPYSGPPQQAQPHAEVQDAVAAPSGQLAASRAPSMVAATAPPKSFLTTWLLALLLGGFGIDRFYLGKIGTGILKLITAGGWGIWSLIDLIITLTGKQRDKQQRALAGYAQHKKLAWIVTAVMLVLGLVIGAVSGIAAASSLSSAFSESEFVDASEPLILDDEFEEEVLGDEAAPVGPALADPGQRPSPGDDIKAWMDERYGSYDRHIVTGVDSELIELPAGATAGLIRVLHNGSAPFTLAVLDTSLAPTGELPVDSAGAYEGTTPFGLDPAAVAGWLEVRTTGKWRVEVLPVSMAPKLAASGTGDSVFLYNGNAASFTAAHSGQFYFEVLEMTGDAASSNFLVQNPGAFSGAVKLGDGPSVIAIGADGDWTFVAK